jgi:hypothetical protein
MSSNVRDLEVIVYAIRNEEPTRRVAPRCADTNVINSDSDGKIRNVSTTIGSGLVFFLANATMLGDTEISRQAPHAAH